MAGRAGAQGGRGGRGVAARMSGGDEPRRAAPPPPGAAVLGGGGWESGRGAQAGGKARATRSLARPPVRRRFSPGGRLRRTLGRGNLRLFRSPEERRQLQVCSSGWA